MRKEATIEEWKELYEAAERIKGQKPWEFLWDMDILGIQYGKQPEDTVFFNVLGKGGECLGMTVYEGYEAFNTFMMLTMHERMNLSEEYALFNQNCLCMYWGDREELSAKQREVIKELGYKFRGKNNWLYFMSYEPGYYPFNLDQDEVCRMTQYLNDFEMAFTYFVEKEVPVKFDQGNMFLFQFSEDRSMWSFGEKELPFTSYVFGSIKLNDEEMIKQLKEVPRKNAVLELDVAVLGASVNDKSYDRPGCPMLSLVVDAASGVALACEMSKPEDDPVIILANELLKFISQYGAPKEVRVSNVIIEAGLEEICSLCGTKLKRVKRLPNINEFMTSMSRFR